MKGKMMRAGAWIVMGLLGTMSPLAGQDTLEWDGNLADGATLKVQGITGSITAVRSSNGTARVRAEKDGRRGDFSEVDIVVEETRWGVTICAVYGQIDPVDCDGNNSDRDDDDRDRSIDVEVDFDVEVPVGVRFEGAMVTGDVRAEDLRSEVDASTVTGDIFVSTSEVAEANTVTGHIEVDMGTADFDDLEFATVSGDITVHLPAGADADVDFSSLSGDFDTDFDLTIRSQDRRFIGSELTGRLGSGGPDLSFRTVSGDVELLRRR